jgi:uncharacterized delta-60 repeat protein
MNIFPFSSSRTRQVTLIVTILFCLGSPDTSIAQSITLVPDPLNASVRDTVLALAAQPDGKFLVGGEFTQIGSTTKRHIARLNADGTLDTSFNASTDDDVYAIALQSDGKILIGGDFKLVNGVQRKSLARLTSTGVLDATFNAGDLDECRSLAIQADGNIIVGGIPYLTRLLPSGATDPGFNLTNNLQTGHRIYALAIQADGKILAGGLLIASSPSSIGLLRLNANGSQDTSFVPQFDLPVRAITVQPADQKILVGGDFQGLIGTPAPFLTRLLPSGALDNGMSNYLGSVGLGISPEGSLGTVYSIALLPTGGFMAAGPVRFRSGSNFISHLARFGPDGLLDTTFNPQLKRTVHQVVNTPGDRLLVGGEFTSIAAVARERIARFASNTPTATVSLSNTGISVPEGDANFTIDVTLTAPIAVPFTVPVSFTGTATAGKDYTRPATSVRFEPGETTKTITVPLIDDTLIEANETLIITLSEPPDPAVSRLTPFVATFTLQSDEVAAQITSQPVAQIVAVGAPATFTATASGIPTPTLEWRKNGTRITGATASTLTLPSVALSNAGNYSMKATVTNTSATSTNASLTVVDQTPVTLPGAATATATLRVTFASPERPTFKWFRNSVAVVDVPNKISGSLSSSLVIRNLATTDSDSYVCEVTTSSGSLNGAPISLVVYDSVPEVIAPMIPPLIIPTAMVSELVSYSIPINIDPLKTPTKFAITGLPTGLKFDPVTGRIFGRATKAGIFDKIKITPSNAKGRGTTVDAKMEILPLTPGVIGSYIANIARNPTVNANLGGSLTLTVSPTGLCSGSLRTAGSTFSFKGPLDTSASGGDPSMVITIPRSTPPSMILDFDFILASSTITGTLKEDGLVPTASVDGHLCLPAPSDRQGYQTVTFDLTDALNIGIESIPQGTGFLTFTVPASGSVRMTGNLPDGTALTLSSRISSSGKLPVYLPLYSATGSLLAEFTVANDANRTVGGALTWSRNPQAPSQRSYQLGFSPTPYTATGGAYIAPASGVPVMSLPATADNAKLTFLEALVSTAIVSPNITFTLGSAAAGTFPTFASGNNPNRVALSVSRSTGTFSGQFTLVNPLTLTKNLTRVAKFKGVIARDGAASTGGGYFILPKLPDPLTAPSNTTPILSGQVNLLPAP